MRPPDFSKRHELVDEHEMAEVIGSELRFETVGGLALRTRHYAGIGDDHIEGFALREQFVCGFAYALERGEVGFDQLDRRVADCGIACRQRVRAPSARSRAVPTTVRAMRDERASSFNAEARRDAGYEHALAGKIDALEHFIGSGFESEILCHDSSLSLGMGEAIQVRRLQGITRVAIL